MTRPAGRPPKPDASMIDPMVRKAAEEVLDHRAPTRRAIVAAPAGPFRRSVLAVRLAEALEVLAAEEIERVRSAKALGWKDVGDAFDITTQTAHHRFRVVGSDFSA